ncbi:MAG: PQQ-dependent sugar dehydrogenase [Verrucomicrobia bacterium]|nr:PQQ-dependent sugar dehydrogenase [Verrucomicrobiota bacterium]
MKHFIFLLALFPAIVQAQTYGIATRPSFTAFNGGTLPANLPTFSGSWSAVPAFPNLTFQNSMGIHEMPGQPANARKLVVYEREGKLWSIPRPSPSNAVAPFTAAELNNTHKTLLIDLTNQCQGWDDSGFLSMAFHPNFATNGFVYIYYSYTTPGSVIGSATVRPNSFTTPHKDRLARFTFNFTTGVFDPASEQVLINLSSSTLWHAGGGMFFHPTTGFLHLTLGDDVAGDTQQQITNNFRSSIIRIDVDKIGGSVSHPIPKQPMTPAGSSTANYYIPNDNPFVGVANAMEEIFCLGLRSPHSMNFDTQSGRAFIGDVGEGTKEEISVVEAGESGLNFQWNRIEGLNGDLTQPYIGINKRPIIDYGRSDGTAVIGGRVYRAAEFDADLGGRFIFGDNVSRNIWYLDETTAPKSKVFLCTLPLGNGVNTGGDYRGLCFFGTDNDHEFYICQLGTTTAQIYKLQRGGAPAPVMPATLSATGLLSDVPNVVPSASFLPMEVNSPLWSDNAHKSRWFAIPTGQTIGFNPTGNHTFPQGSVWLKHFELPTDDNNPAIRKKLETRVLVRDDLGGVYGVTYRWRPDGSDADMVNSSETEDVTINGTSEIGPTLTSTDIGTQVFDQTTTNIGTGYQVGVRAGDLWTNRDHFRGLHAQKTGDFDARVRIESMAGAQGSYAKAGIMARSSTAADSPHVFAMVFPNNAVRNNNNGGHELQYRSTAAGASAAVYPQLPHPRVSYPQTWLRLKREGNTFIHYWSDNGTTWKEYGRRTQTMPATIELGLATTSNNTSTGITARYHLNLQRTQTWFYPGRADCLQCHRQGSGLVLGQTTAQTNKLYEFAAALNGTSAPVTDNQLRAWNHIGLFSPAITEATIPNMLKAVPLTDTSASAEQRMRSYIDMNCSHCHQSTGGGVHAFWDGRFELTLAQTGIVNGHVGNALGLTNLPKVIAPQSIERSIMHVRMGTATAEHKMPPVAKSLVDQQAMAVLEQWINEVTQPPGDPLPTPWVGGDIGSVTVAGSSTTFNSTFILSSNGTGIGGTADSTQAASYQLISGDGELVAQVSSLDAGMTGVMVRETLNPNSKQGSTLLSKVGASTFSRRLTTGGTTVTTAGSTTAGSTAALPRWVKIRRRGPYIESYVSPNGSTWSLIGTDQIAMATSVYFCLVHSSNAATTTGNVTFDNVAVTPGIFGNGSNLTVNNTAANAITWDNIAGISGTSVANGPVLWYQNDTLNFTGTGAAITLTSAANMNTGLLNINATTGNFSLTGASLTTSSIRIGTGDAVIVGSTLAGVALTVGALDLDAVAGNFYNGTLTLNASPTTTGTTTIQSGVVNLNGSALSLASSSAINITGSGVRIPTATGFPFDSGLLRGGLLQLTTGGGDHIGTQPITLNGGSIVYRDTVAGDQTETITNLTLASGGNTVVAGSQGATTADTLTITNLTRSLSATLEARSALGVLGGTGNVGRISITNIGGMAAANTNGILGGWAYAGSGTGLTADFARATASGLAAATPDKATGTAGGMLNNQSIATGSVSENWLLNSAATVDGTTIPTLTLNSLIIESNLTYNNGGKLVIGSGGLIFRTANSSFSTVSGAGAKLTTGTVSGELFIRTPNHLESFADMRIRARIEDNGTTPLIVVKSGPGRINLGANTGTGTVTNAYTGGTIINEGGIFAYDATAFGTGTITVRPGGTVQINNGVTIANAMSLAGFGATASSTGQMFGALRLNNAAIASGAITLAGNARVEVATAGEVGTMSGVISGSGTGIEKSGAGTLAFTGSAANTYTGITIVSAGMLSLSKNDGVTALFGDALVTGTGILATSDNASSRIADTVSITVDGASARFNFGANSNDTMNILRVNNGGIANIGNFASNLRPNGGLMSTGGGSVTQTTGAGGLDFNGLTVPIIVSSGTLTISTGMRSGGFDKSGTGTLLLTLDNTYAGPTLISAGTVQLGNGGATGSLGTTSAITNNGAIIVNRTTAATLTLPAISGTGSYTQTNGTVIMSAVNGFAGPTVINGGTLQLNGGGASGGLRGSVTINAGATLRSTAADSFGYAGGSKVNVLNINGGTFEHTTVNNVTLANVAITMNGGILQSTGAGTAARLDFHSGSTSLTTDAAATSTSTVNGQICLRQSNSMFTVNNGSAAIDLAVNGPLTNSPFGEGNNSILKAGAGTMALNGTSTHTGATTIQNGSLLINGSTMSPITISAGATLGGTGTANSTVMVNGIISPGITVGTLTTGALTLAPNGLYQWEVGAWNGSAGTGFDTVNSSSLNITATSVMPITLRLRNLAGSGFTQTNKSFTLVSTTGGITGFALNKFMLDVTEFTGSTGTWSLAVVGNNLVLSYTADLDTDDDGILDADELTLFGSLTASTGSSDTDKDGISDLLEYATSLSVTTGNLGNWTTDIETIGADQHLRLTVTKNAAATHLTYVIEVSDNLTIWIPAVIEVNTSTQLIARDPMKKADATNRFIRLRVQP